MASGAVAAQIKQRALLGAIQTIYEANGWAFVDLHMNKTNPTAMSGPDILVLRGETMRAIKGLIKGDLSPQQERMKILYEATGCDYRIYYPADFMQIATDADGGTS